jgi:hypothetical protein
MLATMKTKDAGGSRWIIRAVHRIAAIEYALVDACHDAARSAQGIISSLLATRAGAAQVHLFDLGSVLRELGDGSLSYSSFVRDAMLLPSDPDELLRRLERESEQTIKKSNVPDGLRVLLRANLAEHRGLGEMAPPAGALAV